VPVSFGIALFLTETCPQSWLRRPLGTAIELLAGVPSIIYGIWGLFVLAPLFQQRYIQPWLIRSRPGCRCSPVRRYGIGMFTAGMVLALMVIPFTASVMRDVFETVPPVLKESAYGLGCTTWEVVCNVVLPYTRVGVIGGVMLGTRGRALGETMAVTFVIGNAQSARSGSPVRARQLDRLDARQRVRRGDRRESAHAVAVRTRPHPLRHHLRRAGGGLADRLRHAAQGRGGSTERDG
jgi:phosphate transport system permease protein